MLESAMGCDMERVTEHIKAQLVWLVDEAPLAFPQTVANEAQAPGLPTEVQDSCTVAGGEDEAAALLSLATLQLLNVKTTVLCWGKDSKKSLSMMKLMRKWAFLGCRKGHDEKVG